MPSSQDKIFSGEARWDCVRHILETMETRDRRNNCLCLMKVASLPWVGLQRRFGSRLFRLSC